MSPTRGLIQIASGISGLGEVYYNLIEPDLITQALRREEGELGRGGAILVSTGKFTGRSPMAQPPGSDTRAWP